MPSQRQSRRTFLRRTAGVVSSAAIVAPRSLFGQAPAIVGSDSGRPSTAFGATAGDVDVDRAMVWSRTDRPRGSSSSTRRPSPSTDVRRVVGPAALEATDYTARVDLTGLPAGQRIFYRVRVPEPDAICASGASQSSGRSPRPGGRTVARRDRRVDGGHSRAGVGHQHRTGWHASLRGDARRRRGRVHPHRRHDLR